MTRDLDASTIDIELVAGDRDGVPFTDLGQVDSGLARVYVGLVPLQPDDAIQRMEHDG